MPPERKLQRKLMPPLWWLKLAEGANVPGHHFLIVTEALGLFCLSRAFPFWISTQPVLISGGPFTGHSGSLMPPPLVYPVLPERWPLVVSNGDSTSGLFLQKSLREMLIFLLLYNGEAAVGRCPQGEQTLRQAGGHLRGEEGYG